MPTEIDKIISNMKSPLMHNNPATKQPETEITGKLPARTSPEWFDFFPDSAFIMNPEGVILDANKAFASRFQKLPQECIGTNVYQLLPPEMASQRRKIAEEALRTAKQLSWEEELNNRILRNSASPIINAEGKANQLIIIEQDVTDLKLKGLILENESAINKTIIDTIPGTFYILDANGRYAGWNTYQREIIVGKTESEMKSVKAIETIHPDDRDLISKKILNVLTHGSEEIVEGRVLLQGGPEFRWFLMTGKRLFIAGNPCLVGMGIDITERKQNENVLQQNEERFRTLFESHSAIQIILDPETGDIIDANQAASDFYGWSIEQLKQMCIHEINPLSAKKISTILKKWHSSKKLNFSFRHQKANGSIRDVEVFANKVSINGKPLVYCIIHDISQRKQIESLSAFRLSLLEMARTHSVETLLRTTLNEAEQLTSSAIGFCHFIGNSHHPETIQVMSSKMHNRMRNMKTAGPRHPSLKETDFWTDVIREKKSLINNNCSRNQESIPDDHHWVKRTLVVPLMHKDTVMAILGIVNKPSDYDEDDIHWVTMLANIAWDIVAKKLADEELEKIQCQLQQFQKMEVVGQLAGGIAHDFNNMMAIILGNTEMTMELVEPGKPVYANLEIIRKAAIHSADLTRQLLAFARKQTVISKIITINSIIEEMLPMLRRLISNKITLLWIPEKRHMQIKIDPAQIDQILTNLCINARDAITGTGQITIETGVLHIDKIDGTSSQPYTLPGDYVTLTVSDNGCGIEKKNLPHIFEPFFTTKEVGKGTGMGLSTVYGIVKQNNGSIECISIEGEGTRFRITLPMYNQEAVAEESNIEPLPEKSSGLQTILLVEDEPDILKLCRLMLESRGYKVLTASKAVEAIKIAQQYKESINLLLTDVIMPEINGNELSKSLQSLIPDLKTLFMSGYITDTDFYHKMASDNVNFIQKPFSLNTLIDAVYKSLND